MDDVVNAGVLKGIYCRFSDTVARRTGKRAADWTFSHVMQPIDR